MNKLQRSSLLGGLIPTGPIVTEGSESPSSVPESLPRWRAERISLVCNSRVFLFKEDCLKQQEQEQELNFFLIRCSVCFTWVVVFPPCDFLSQGFCVQRGVLKAETNFWSWIRSWQCEIHEPNWPILWFVSRKAPAAILSAEGRRAAAATATTTVKLHYKIVVLRGFFVVFGWWPSTPFVDCLLISGKLLELLQLSIVKELGKPPSQEAGASSSSFGVKELWETQNHTGSLPARWQQSQEYQRMWWIQTEDIIIVIKGNHHKPRLLHLQVPQVLIACFHMELQINQFWLH